VLKLSSDGEIKEKKQGVEKFIYMLSGSMEAIVSTETYNLKQGDNLYFDASLPHTFKNKGKTKAEALCVISPIV